MYSKNLISGAAVLLASISTVSALGVATVVNNCGSPVYYASVGGSANPGMTALEGSYSQGYSGENVGVSIKLAPEASASGPISQFEITLSGSMIFYDMSNINGNPFASEGMEIVPSVQNDPAFPTCIPVSCPAGAATCTAAYNNPDDVRTMVCSSETSLTLTMCPGGGSKKRDTTLVMPQRLHARHFTSLV
jgi:hypothetical protein